MTNKQERLVEFVTHYFAPNTDPRTCPASAQPTKSADELAQGLLQSFEFRALRLGTWLGTSEGVNIASAVEQVLPSSYRIELTLIIDGLKLAAKLQAEEEGRYAADVVEVVAVTALLALLTYALTRPAGRRTA